MQRLVDKTEQDIQRTEKTIADIQAEIRRNKQRLDELAREKDDNQNAIREAAQDVSYYEKHIKAIESDPGKYLQDHEYEASTEHELNMSQRLLDDVIEAHRNYNNRVSSHEVILDNGAPRRENFVDRYEHALDCLHRAEVRYRLVRSHQQEFAKELLRYLNEGLKSANKAAAKLAEYQDTAHRLEQENDEIEANIQHLREDDAQARDLLETTQRTNRYLTHLFGVCP